MKKLEYLNMLRILLMVIILTVILSLIKEIISLTTLSQNHPYRKTEKQLRETPHLKINLSTKN
jgi:uncharacterized membrane protein YcjF (UPF0283 family)